MTEEEIALELMLQKRRQGAFGGAPVETAPQGAFGMPPISDSGPLPGQEWPESYDPQSGEQFLGMVGDTAINAADPFNIPSALVGIVSPEARDAWRLRQEQSDPVARGVGQAIGPMGAAGAVLRSAKSLPALMTAGGAFGAGSDVIDQAAGVDGAVGVNTALKGTMGSLGMGTAAMSPKMLAGMAAGGGGLVAADVARGGVGGNGERIDISSAQSELATIDARMKEIDAQKLANGKDKKLSPSRTESLNSQLEDERKRLEKRQSAISGSISGERRAREMENAPLRERYPLATLGATLASLPAAFGLARSGLNKIAGGVNEKVQSARTAATEARGTDFIRDTEAAQSLARSAPFKSAAVVGASGMVPAEVQMIPDLMDYKTMPRDSRAFKEAQDTFKDPGTYVKNLAVPAIGGLVSAGTAFAKSDMLKNSGMAGAKALGGSLKGMDKRLSTEGKAEEWARRTAKAKDAESDLVEANLRNAEARAKKPAEAAPKPPRLPQMSADDVASKLKELEPPKREFVAGKRPDDPDHGRVHALRESPEVQKSVAKYVALMGKKKVTGPDVIAALKEIAPDMSTSQASRVAIHLRRKDDFLNLVEAERKSVGRVRGSRDGKAALEALNRTKKEKD